MSVRELVVLGTASQVPTRYRNHNGYLLRWDADGILFDPGEGTQRQMTFAGVSASSVTRICITHFHGDHCLGLPGVVHRLSLDQVNRAIPLHFPAEGAEYVHHLLHASMFEPARRVEPHPATPGVVATTPALTVHARALDHGVPVLGWRIEEPARVHMLPDRLAALGIAGPAVGELERAGALVVDGRTVRLDEVSETRRGQVFALVMDTRPCQGALELAEGADLLVAEATFAVGDADLAERYGHMTTHDAAWLAREAGVRQLVLTHFSQRYPDVTPLLDEARGIFPDTVAANDLDRIPLARPPRA